MPQGLVLYYGEKVFFETTEESRGMLKRDWLAWGCVRGASGGVSCMPWRDFMFPSICSCKSATKPELVLDQKFAMKAKTEIRIKLYR